jgi:uncharacterized protein (DUF433 family)
MQRPPTTTPQQDRRERPAYTVAEAAHHVRVPSATLSTWVFGRRYPTATGQRTWLPLIKPADPARRLLSFNNLVEAHVLASLRKAHGSRIPQIREAIHFAEAELGIERLLLSERLATSAGDLFMEHLGRLLNLSRSGQLTLQAVVRRYLKLVERDLHHLPVRLYPAAGGEPTEGRGRIVIDPDVGFGRPTIVGRGIGTAAIVARIDAGEAVGAVAEDYDISEGDIEEALLYERMAA